ncbi:hypothetical protein V2I01_08710 [Micromonospora sp. BRA006-A]|nr:hypothetical protein [Micromonospora sp. BRA006-A]
MFEDVTGAPGEVRPAWPITPAGRPHRATTDPDAPARDGAEATALAEPATRPRHRGLREPGASTGWDALAERPPTAGPLARPEAGKPVARPEAATAVPGEAGAALPDTTAALREATAAETEADSGAGGTPDRTTPTRPVGSRSPGAACSGATGPRMSRSRPSVRPSRPPLPTTSTVDWVAGLASDDNADDARSLRTGRHHRD